MVGAGVISLELTVSVAEGASPAGAVGLHAVALRFEDFYAAHRDEMARALGLALRDAALGAEAADEALARACQRWGQVSAYENPHGWVFRVGLNWARSWLRRARRERDRQRLVVQPDATEDQTRDLDLERALAALSGAHRDVIVARFYLDWSVAETAEALGIAPGTVKSRLSRGLEQLRDAMASDGADASVLGAGEAEIAGGGGVDVGGAANGGSRRPPAAGTGAGTPASTGGRTP